MDDHGETELGANLNIPLSVEFSLSKKFAVGEYQNDPDVDELLHEDQSENGLVFDSGTVLVLEFGRNYEELLSNNVDGYNDERLGVYDHLTFRVGLEPFQAEFSEVAVEHLVEIAEAVAMEDISLGQV